MREFIAEKRVALKAFARKIDVNPKSVLETAKLYGFNVKNGYIIMEDREKIIFNLLKLGFDLEDILRYFDWRDLESICGAFLTISGFYTIRNFRFKTCGKRYEIDVIGIKNEKVLLIDCKKWRKMSGSMLKTAVEKQLERALALSKIFDTLKLRIDSDRVVLIPAIVTMLPGSIFFHNSVPVIPISKFNSFLSNIENMLDNLTLIEVKLGGLFRGGHQS